MLLNHVLPVFVQSTFFLAGLAVADIDWLHGKPGPIKYSPRQPVRGNGKACSAEYTYPTANNLPYSPTRNRVTVNANDAYNKWDGFLHRFGDTQVLGIVNFVKISTTQLAGYDDKNKAVYESLDYLAPRITLDNQSNKRRSVLLGIYLEGSNMKDPKTKPQILVNVSADPHMKNDDCTIINGIYLEAGSVFTLESV